jgi:hypothetical protein
MKILFFYLIFFFVLTIPAQGQILVQNNGHRQGESTIAVNPNGPNIMATAVIEPDQSQTIVCVSTNYGSSWIQKNTVLNSTDPVIEFDNTGNLFFSYLNKSNFFQAVTVAP